MVASTKPVAGQKVRVYRYGSPSGDWPMISWEDEAVTNGDGRFACDRVIPGRQIVDRLFAGATVKGIVPGLATSIEVREGPAGVNLVARAAHWSAASRPRRTSACRSNGRRSASNSTCGPALRLAQR